MKTTLIFKYLVLGVINSLFIFSVPLAISIEAWFLLSILSVGVLLINYTYLSSKRIHLKFLTPGILVMIAFVIFPAFFNFYVSLTNWQTGHILNKNQAIERIEERTFVDESLKNVEFVIFVFTDSDENLFFLADIDESNKLFGQAFVNYDNLDSNNYAKNDLTLFSNGVPQPPSKLRELKGKELIAISKQLEDLSLVVDKATIIKLKTISVFGNSKGYFLANENKFSYDEQDDLLYDNELKTYCETDLKIGNFICNNNEIFPGWRVFVGFTNYFSLFQNTNITGTLKIVTYWTFAFAFLSLIFCFALGLGLTLLLNKNNLKFKLLYKTIYILPYAIPGFVSVFVWRGLLSPEIGPINEIFEPFYNLLGIDAPKWFVTKNASRAGILLVNTWLGFPYMFLITTGALQSIPNELIEAANMDGASKFKIFTKITFPLLMVSISPLLIGAFAYNFNNFTLIYLLTGGGPAIPGSLVPAGWTDILISFTYSIAISGGRGNMFGLASAVTVIIFGIVLLISAISFKYSKRLESVYGNL